MTEISLADQLQKLDELRQRGVISQQEFDAFKVQLLVSGSAAPSPPPTAVPPPPAPIGAAPVGGAFSRVAEATSGALKDPGGYYQEHKKGIDEAAGAGLIAEGLGVVPGRWRVHGLWFLGLFFGALLVFIGWGLMNKGKVPASYTGIASATVTALNATSSTDSNGATTTSCQPTATFVVAHKAYTVTSSETQSPCHSSIGSTVTVDYQPSNPANAMMKPVLVPATISWTLVVLGCLAILSVIIRFIRTIAMLGGGAALLYKGVKKDKRQTES